jgi:hypothetical protein
MKMCRRINAENSLLAEQFLHQSCESQPGIWNKDHGGASRRLNVSYD